MRLHLAFIIALLLVISGCAKTDPSCASPSIPFEEGCCLDINRNGACDRIENSPEAEAAAEETVEEEAVSEESVRTVSPTIPLATVIPVIGTGGKETKDTTKWESIKLYYQDSIGRCGGSTIQFSSFDSASDSIFLKIAGEVKQ